MQSFSTKAKRAIQKVAAIGTGVAMMGATITGALAVSIKLNDYPSAFKDALVVVGTAAAGADDVAATDISGDLPTTSKVSQISGDTYTIEKSGDKFNIGEYLFEVDESVTNTELDLLTTQTFKDGEGANTDDKDYKQSLILTNRTGGLVFEIDNSGDRDGNPADTYLKFSDNQDLWAWNYSLKFTGSKIKVKDAADIENNVLSILGRDWTITDATMSNTSYGTIDKLTLLAGDVLQTILQGSSIGGVTVVDVDEAETKCIVEYAGKTYIIDKGQTKTMDDGTIIGITDVTAVHESGAGQDMCELAIGAHKLALEHGTQVKVNNEDVDNTYTYISGDESTVIPGLKSITVSYQPTDIVRLLPGQSLDDPVFGAFKIVFNNIIEKNAETIKVDPSGSKIRLTVQNRDGDIFDDDYCYLNDSKGLILGYSNYKPIAVFNNQNITNSSVGVEGTGLAPKGLKGVRFLMSFNGISHIAEITSIDTAKNETNIKLLDTGEVYSKLSYTDGTVKQLSDIHSSLRITFNINQNLDGDDASNINFVAINDAGPSWFTKNDGNITFLNSTGGTIWHSAGLTGARTCNLQFREMGYSSKTSEGVVIGKANDQAINISFLYDSTDDNIEWNTTGGKLGASVTLLQKDTDSQYNYVGRTNYGTRIEMYTKDDGDLTIYLPEEEVYAEVIVAASEAVTGALGTVTPVKESEVTDVAAQNVILVGGPCANGLTAKFTGESKTWPDCNTNYKAGEAMLKLLDNGNKVALVVAGYNAVDTQRAAIALSGTLPKQTSAKVTGTSLELSEIIVV